MTVYERYVCMLTVFLAVGLKDLYATFMGSVSPHANVKDGMS